MPLFPDGSESFEKWVMRETIETHAIVVAVGVAVVAAAVAMPMDDKIEAMICPKTKPGGMDDIVPIDHQKFFVFTTVAI